MLPDEVLGVLELVAPLPLVVVARQAVGAPAEQAMQVVVEPAAEAVPAPEVEPASGQGPPVGRPPYAALAPQAVGAPRAVEVAWFVAPLVEAERWLEDFDFLAVEESPRADQSYRDALEASNHLELFRPPPQAP